MSWKRGQSRYRFNHFISFTHSLTPSIHPSNHPPTSRTSVHPPIHPPTHFPSIHPSINQAITYKIRIKLLNFFSADCKLVILELSKLMAFCRRQSENTSNSASKLRKARKNCGKTNRKYLLARFSPLSTLVSKSSRYWGS